MYDIRSEIPHRGGTKERGVEAPNKLLDSNKRYLVITRKIQRAIFDGI